MRPTQPLALLLGVTLSFTGCDTTEFLGPGAAQGIEGVVLSGPQCPVQTVENPCPDLPLQAKLDVRTLDGSPVTQTQSAVDGSFRIGLRPGRYVLVPQSGNPFPTASAQEVLVEEGVYTSVVVNFDTGIR